MDGETHHQLLPKLYTTSAIPSTRFTIDSGSRRPSFYPRLSLPRSLYSYLLGTTPATLATTTYFGDGHGQADQRSCSLIIYFCCISFSRLLFFLCFDNRLFAPFFVVFSFLHTSSVFPSKTMVRGANSFSCLIIFNFYTLQIPPTARDSFVCCCIQPPFFDPSFRSPRTLLPFIISSSGGSQRLGDFVA
jgi:hypothetical protein